MNEQKKSYIPVNCGDIVIASLPCGEGSVQSGKRPCIVLGNMNALRNSPVCQVIPLTSQPKRYIPPHVLISAPGLQRVSVALCEQILTITKDNIVRKVSSLNGYYLNAVKMAVRQQLWL